MKIIAHSAAVSVCFKRGSFHDLHHHKNANKMSSSHCWDSGNETLPIIITKSKGEKRSLHSLRREHEPNCKRGRRVSFPPCEIETEQEKKEEESAYLLCQRRTKPEKMKHSQFFLICFLNFLIQVGFNYNFPIFFN